MICKGQMMNLFTLISKTAQQGYFETTSLKIRHKLCTR